MKTFLSLKLKGSEKEVLYESEEGVINVQDFLKDLNNKDNDDIDDSKDNSNEGTIIEVINNCIWIILKSSKLNKVQAFGIIKEAMANLMSFIKETKDNLLLKKEKNDYVFIPETSVYTSEDMLLIQQLESSTIYLLNLTIRLISEIKGKK